MQTDATLLANNSQHCWILHIASVCTPCWSPKSYGFRILPTMHCRSQHCGKLLNPFAHHCQHRRNNFHHCWGNKVGGYCARSHVFKILVKEPERRDLTVKPSLKSWTGFYTIFNRKFFFVLFNRYVFAAIYTLEMILKIISKGFALHKYAYLRDPWNWLDFVVVILG